MSSGRIQKLLYSEYSELEDMILVESPFAETTRDGNGLQQVYLGLTQNHLIVAADMIRPVDDVLMLCCCEVDPYVDDFELISIYPLQLVHISVYCLRKKHVLKMHFCNNVIRYFELGGTENKKTNWKLWCEHIKFLCPDNPCSSQSETSTFSTSSYSSIHLASRRIVRKPSGALQLWQHFQSRGSGDEKKVHHKVHWAQKDQYFGTKQEQPPSQSGETASDSEMQLVYKNEQYREDSENDLKQCCSSDPCVHKRQFVINRFGSGIPENCTTALLMKPMIQLPTESKHQISTEKSGMQTQRKASTVHPSEQTDKPVVKIKNLQEVFVQMWEPHVAQKKQRHLRRYGLEPLPFFCHGLGLLQVIAGDTYTIQVKRIPSAVTLCKFATSQHQLKSSISCVELHKLSASQMPFHQVPRYRVPIVLFWTPGFSYRPALNMSGFRNVAGLAQQQRTTCSSKGHSPHFQEKIYINLQNTLRSDLKLSSWEFDSLTVACQLTIIDRDLFLRVPVSELGMVLQQRSSKNAFNIRAIIWFASRIASLVTSQIINEKSLKVRVRLICRFINAAYKCYIMNNFQSCRSIVAGLQSPPTYRLHQSWAAIRRHYVTRYRMFEEMCRHYSSPHSFMCREEFELASSDLPFLPYIGSLLTCLLTDTSVAWKQMADSSPFQQLNTKDSCSFFEPVLTDSEVNAARLREVSKLLVTSQKAANRFQLPPNKVAQSFLLKAKYKEDKDNFFQTHFEDSQHIQDK